MPLKRPNKSIFELHSARNSEIFQSVMNRFDQPIGKGFQGYLEE
jgi:hypothetical protein